MSETRPPVPIPPAGHEERILDTLPDASVDMPGANPAQRGNPAQPAVDELSPPSPEKGSTVDY